MPENPTNGATFVVTSPATSEDAGSDSFATMCADFVNTLRGAGYSITVATLTNGSVEDIKAYQEG